MCKIYTSTIFNFLWCLQAIVASLDTKRTLEAKLMMGRGAEASVCVRPVCQVCKMTNMPTCATCVHMHIECERGRVGHGMKVCSAPDCVLVCKSLCVPSANMFKCTWGKVCKSTSSQEVGCAKGWFCASVEVSVQCASVLLGWVCVYCVPRCY